MTIKTFIKSHQLKITFLLMIAFIVGIVILTIPFFPKPKSASYFYSATDPKSDINNLNEDGKKMVYAGIGLTVGGFVGLGLIIKFG